MLGWGLLVVMLATTGCTTYHWEAKRARKSPPPEGSVEGVWEGRWHDEKRPKHGGRLQMVLTREGDQVYRAATRSTWWMVFSSGMTTRFVLTPVAEGAFLVQGGEQLWLFGGHSVTGRVDQARFSAVYTVGKHRGVMEMTRPVEE
jgi:hypothetical protein